MQIVFRRVFLITPAGTIRTIIQTLRETRKKERKRIKNMTITRLTRHIGSTTYQVKIYLPETGNENVEDKILRMIQNEALDIPAGCDILNVPQMSRQSERSANERETG